MNNHKTGPTDESSVSIIDQISMSNLLNGINYQSIILSMAILVLHNEYRSGVKLHLQNRNNGSPLNGCNLQVYIDRRTGDRVRVGYRPKRFARYEGNEETQNERPEMGKTYI